MDTTVRQVFGNADAFDDTAHLRTYMTQSAWGQDELATMDHMFNPFGPGWLLDRHAFDARLLDAVRQAGVRVLADVAVVNYSFDSHWDLLVGPGPSVQHVTARYVCDASGRRAAVARTLGTRVVHDDRLTAIACTFVSAEDRAPTITIESAPFGWWYTAPIPGGRRVVTLFTDADLVNVTRLLEPGTLAARAEETEHIRVASRSDDRPPRRSSRPEAAVLPR